MTGRNERRERLREIKKLSIGEFEAFLRDYGKDNCFKGYSIAMEDGMLAMLKALRQEFQFGNSRMDRLMKAFSNVIVDITEGKTSAREIYRDLQNDNITCLDGLELPER